MLGGPYLFSLVVALFSLYSLGYRLGYSAIIYYIMIFLIFFIGFEGCRTALKPSVFLRLSLEKVGFRAAKLPSNCPNKLPLHIRTDSLPCLILNIQLVSVLEQRKTRQMFVHFQQLTKLIENIAITQEVSATLGNMLLECRLDFTKHMSQLFLILSAHKRGILTT